jgi:hypothetical protein
MHESSVVRQLIQERNETPEILKWLKLSPMRRPTWLGKALEYRLNILRVEQPQLPAPNTYDEALNLLEQHYLQLEADLLLRLPLVEQLYYDKILANWGEVTCLLCENGALTISRQYGEEGEPSITLNLSCSKEVFFNEMEHKWHLCDWSNCKSLFVVQK